MLKYPVLANTPRWRLLGICRPRRSGLLIYGQIKNALYLFDSPSIAHFEATLVFDSLSVPNPFIRIWANRYGDPGTCDAFFGVLTLS
jgi:hypothetical protein